MLALFRLSSQRSAACFSTLERVADRAPLVTRVLIN